VINYRKRNHCYRVDIVWCIYAKKTPRKVCKINRPVVFIMNERIGVVGGKVGKGITYIEKWIGKV